VDCRATSDSAFLESWHGSVASEAFQRMIYQRHLDGTIVALWEDERALARPPSSATFSAGSNGSSVNGISSMSKILGIDEHFFTRRKGFATTLCD